MKPININLLLNFLLSTLAILTTKSLAQVVQERSKFIVVHPASVNPFSGIVSIDEAKPKRLMRVKTLFFTAADLTEDENIRMQPRIIKAGGMTAPNNRIRSDDMTGAQGNMLQKFFGTSSATAQQPTGEFISNTPRCLPPVNNVDFVILDTVAFQNISELSNVKITYGPNFVGNTTACNPRATEVASIIAGNTLGVIPRGNRGIYNIAVFDCAGFGIPEDVISGANAAIEFSNANLRAGRRTVVIFAGIRGMNRAVDAAAAALVNAGIPAFIAGGNSGIDACVYELPPVAPFLYTVASTTSPGDVPADFTNYGNPCVNSFLPGDNLKVATVINGALVNNTRLVSGTQYSVAIAAALGGMELELDPTATALTVLDRINESPRTSVIFPPPDSFFHQTMTVMREGNACPYNRLFNTYVAKKINRNSFSIWYDGANSNSTLCASFKVRATNGGVLIGLRANTTDLNPIKVKISDFRRKRSDYISTITENGIILDQEVSRNSIIPSKNDKVVTIRYVKGVVSASYDDLSNNDPTPLLFAHVRKIPTQISFSNTNAEVVYSNALRCLI